MNHKGRIRIILSLLIVTLVACSNLTPKPAETTRPEGPQMTVKGKIDYMTALGGYFVRCLEPTGEFFITNQDPKLLEELFRSGKILTIEGRINLNLGAEYLFIEKIDGQPYRAETTK